jgi:hypothetical protein
VLVLGPLDGVGPAEFSFTALQMPISAGVSGSALQGQWSEDLAAGTATFHALRAYLLPDERSTSLLSRTGVTRESVDRTLRLAVSRSDGVLTLSGDPALAGAYVPYRVALARLGTATDRDATCAFQIANLGIRASEVRIIGFGGPGMTQYRRAADYLGVLSGSMRVSLDGSLTSTSTTTTITYSGFEDLGGSRVEGPQVTRVNGSGDGHMSGTVTFALTPLAPDGTELPAVSGALDYGGGDDPGDAVQISRGNPTGGHYTMTLAGGGSARVSPVTAPSPSVAECLALP